jgi:phage shock protein E
MVETENRTLEELIAHNKGTIVDVRTYQEYLGGHVAGSILAPLNEIERKIDLLRGLRQPLILVCRTGNRSGQATEILKKKGIQCVNGGAWTDVNYLKSRN